MGVYFQKANMGGEVSSLGSNWQKKLKIIFPKICNFFSSKIPPDLLFTILNTCLLYFIFFFGKFLRKFQNFQNNTWILAQESWEFFEKNIHPCCTVWTDSVLLRSWMSELRQKFFEVNSIPFVKSFLWKLNY